MPRGSWPRGPCAGQFAGLRTLASQRLGALMLSVVAIGFLALGLHSLIGARCRDDLSR